MSTKFYCPNCNKEEETKIIEKETTYNIKGLDITLNEKIRVCTHCGEAVYDEKLLDEMNDAYYNEYRKQKNLLQPSEIASIRSSLGLSQSSFSKLLGFGDKTITRYENGAIQDDAHDNLIRCANTIEGLKAIWESKSDRLSETDTRKIRNYIQKVNKVKKLDRIELSFYQVSTKYCTTKYCSSDFKDSRPYQKQQKGEQLLWKIQSLAN